MVAAALIRGGVQNQLLADFHNAGFLGKGAAAPAHKYIHISRGHAVGPEKVQDHLLAHGQLVIGGGILHQLRSVVEDALGIHILFVLEVAHLGGGGTGVDNQHFDRGIHSDNLLYGFRREPWEALKSYRADSDSICNPIRAASPVFCFLSYHLLPQKERGLSNGIIGQADWRNMAKRLIRNTTNSRKRPGSPYGRAGPLKPCGHLPMGRDFSPPNSTSSSSGENRYALLP